MTTMKLKLGEEEKEVPVGVTALVVYEQQFKSDMIKDVFGRSVIRKQENEPDIEFAIDYRDTNWTALIKSAWACLKASDSNTPRFETWSEELPDIDLNALANVIIPAMFEAFFRAGVSHSE